MNLLCVRAGVHKSQMPGCRRTKFYTVVPAYGSLLWDLLQHTILAPEIIRWVLDLWNWVRESVR